jgi:hypothetical protein
LRSIGMNRFNICRVLRARENCVNSPSWLA